MRRREKHEDADARWIMIQKAALGISMIMIIWLAAAGHTAFDSTFYATQFSENMVYERIPNAAQIAGRIRTYFVTGDIDMLSQSGLSQIEIWHMQDVRDVMLDSLLIMFTSILVAAGAIAMIARWTRHAKAHMLDAGIWGTACSALGITILPLILSRFARCFELFHSMLFARGTWTFPSGSILITMFPTQFWKNALMILCLKALVISLSILAICLMHKRRMISKG